MGQPIRHITISGRGTAGWIVAAYLNHKLQDGIGAQPGCGSAQSNRRAYRRSASAKRLTHRGRSRCASAGRGDHRFSREIDRLYDEVRDFLGLHFVLSDRNDTPYRRAARHKAKRSDTLTQNLALWRHRSPIREDVRAGAAFGHVAIQGRVDQQRLLS